MLSRLWAARLAVITVLLAPAWLAGQAGWLAQAVPAAQASTAGQAGAGQAAGSGGSMARLAGRAARRPGVRAARRPGVRVARPGGRAARRPGRRMTVPDAGLTAAMHPAPLVSNARPARAKRGLAAPPMTAAMLGANAAKQAAARNFLREMGSRAEQATARAVPAVAGCRPHGASGRPSGRRPGITTAVLPPCRRCCGRSASG